MGFTNFLVTKFAASLPEMEMRIRKYEHAVIYTHCHHTVQFRWSKSNHNGIGITIYDLRIM